MTSEPPLPVRLDHAGATAGPGRFFPAIPVFAASVTVPDSPQ